MCAPIDAYLDALGRGDLAGARACLADSGFSFTAPIGTYADADTFVNRVWGVLGILEGIDRRRRFIDGRDVMDVLVFRTRFDDAERTDIVQWAQVEGGRIQRLELFFDAHDYKSMFRR